MRFQLATCAARRGCAVNPLPWLTSSHRGSTLHGRGSCPAFRRQAGLPLCFLAHFLFAPAPVFEFKRKKAGVTSDGDKGRPPRFFEDGIAALRYACRFLDCALHEGAFLPAVVLDPSELFKGRAAVTTGPDGSRIFFLCVASSDGGFVVAASPAGPKGPVLMPGQLVSWKAVRHVPEIAAGRSDPRFGWVGAIVGTLKLEQRDGCWISEDIFRAAPVAAA